MAKNSGGRWILAGILLAVILGVLAGGFLPQYAAQTKVLGDVFLNALFMVVVPLIMCSMIVGVASLGDVRHLGAIGRRTLLYFLATTLFSSLLGLLLVNLVKPGKGASPGEKHPELAYNVGGQDGRTVTLAAGAWKRTAYDQRYVLSLTDQRIQGVIRLISEQSVTVKRWEPAQVEHYVRAQDGTLLPFRTVEGRLVSEEPRPAAAGQGVEIALQLAERVRGKETRTAGNTVRDILLSLVPRNLFQAMVSVDALALIVFSLLLGAALVAIGDRGRPAVDAVSSLNDAVMRLVAWIMVLAPVGIFGLVAAKIGEAGGFLGFWPHLQALGKYAFTVVLGLLIHGCGVLPLLLRTLGRRGPLAYARNMAPALLNAFSCASSSATLPLSMDGVTRGNGISARTANFVLPLGATVNMNGTALYEAVAAIFIAQVYGMDLSLGQQVMVSLTATLAAIGAAGIPEAGLVTMVIVLKAVDLPVEGIGLILTIDWLLDRCRTTVNVWDDAVAAAVIERMESSDCHRESSSYDGSRRP